MTAQFKNEIVYQGKNYDFEARSNDTIWFDPKNYGFEPDGNRNTACRAGYVCKYKIENDCLILDRLNIYDKYKNYHPINDVMPSIEKEFRWAGDVEYRNLRIILDNVTQELLLRNDKELLCFDIVEGRIKKVEDYSNIQNEIDKYCEERMTPEEFALRGKDLLSLPMDDWDKKKRDVDMLPYDYVNSHWWLLNEIKREPYGDDKSYNYYELTRRNSMLNFNENAIVTIDGNKFDINEFEGKIELIRKKERKTETHFLRSESYWEYTYIEKCALSIYNQNKYVRTSDYNLNDDEIEMVKKKYNWIVVEEKHKEGERA